VDGKIVCCENVTLGYGALVVLEDVNLEMQAGSYVGIGGPNGAGKTTLLKALTGILRPLSGSVWVAAPPSGRPLRFGYVAQTTTLDDSYPVSALDVVMMGRVARVGPFRRFSPDDFAESLAALERAGMAHCASWPFRELSRGEQQRVLLARALAGEPDVLVLDEPTNFLDLRAQMEFMHTIEAMRSERQMSVLIVTHLLQEVAEHADTVWLVQGGRLRVLADRDAIQRELFEVVGAGPALQVVAGA
jgi:ABC-type Mn2+/Zn2+ transport system ATPase subunit